jgi:hypothetical protein
MTLDASALDRFQKEVRCRSLHSERRYTNAAPEVTTQVRKNLGKHFDLV